MSSALSSLKKMKKYPLPSTVPFRNAGASHPDISEENELLEEVTSHMTATRLKDLHSQSVVNIGHKPTVSRISTHTKNAPSDHELMMLMTNRITGLETRLQSQSQELVDRDKRIRILEEKLKILKKSRVEGSSEKLNQLERKCLLLQQQVYEMEAFLADYGMIWVGDKTDPDSSVYLDDDDEASDSEGRTAAQELLDPKSPRVWRPAESVASAEFAIDCNQFVRNINELNVLAGDGIAKIQHTPDGARLRVPDPVQLTLYSNGLLMFNGPFRPFSDAQTQDLVKDILDGYFPSELQGRFPEGVPFKFTDKHDVVFKDKRSEVFQGEGQVLGGETSQSRLVLVSATKDSKSRSSDATVESAVPGPKLTMEQFLNRIPKSVVKNGKLIDIRNSLQETITGKDATTGAGIVTVVDTPQLRELKGRLEVDEAERPSSSRPITTLRIKSELGDRTYIVKMRFTDTIGDLRKYLNKERGVSKSNYKIMSAFPKTVFDDDRATLQQSGLTPNATLHLLTSD